VKVFQENCNDKSNQSAKVERVHSVAGQHLLYTEILDFPEGVEYWVGSTFFPDRFVHGRIGAGAHIGSIFVPLHNASFNHTSVSSFPQSITRCFEGDFLLPSTHSFGSKWQICPEKFQDTGRAAMTRGMGLACPFIEFLNMTNMFNTVNMVNMHNMQDINLHVTEQGTQKMPSRSCLTITINDDAGMLRMVRP
jgi:hypothetical protein